MKKDLIKIAMIGLAAGFCVSAKEVQSKKNQEVAMAKCTKSNTNKKCDQSCNGKKGADAGCNGKTSAGRNGYSLEQYKPKTDEIAGKRKSAAQKVLEGSS